MQLNGDCRVSKGMKRTVNPTLEQAAAGLVLLLTAAHVWARGGGGGGGHGGGGGGHGFGGGGYHSGYYGGYHGGYYGGQGGGTGLSWTALLTIFGLLVLFVILSQWSERQKAAVAERAAQRASLVSLVVVLDNAAHYVPALQALAARSSFGTPQGRTRARTALSALVRPEDVRDGFVQTQSGRRVLSGAGQEAQELWKHLIRLADVSPETVNVSAPGQRLRASETATRRENTGVCLLGIAVLFAAPCVSEGGAETARAMLSGMGQMQTEAFYFFYTPGPGESLTAPEAAALLAKMRQE